MKNLVSRGANDFSSLLLLVSAVLPFSHSYIYFDAFVAIKGLLLFLCVLSCNPLFKSRSVIACLCLLVLSIVLSIDASPKGSNSFSIIKYTLLYLVVFAVYCSKIFEIEFNERVLFTYVQFSVFTLALTYYYPLSTGFFYGWNGIEQYTLFVSNGTMLGIYGLPTAGAMVIFLTLVLNYESIKLRRRVLFSFCSTLVIVVSLTTLNTSAAFITGAAIVLYVIFNSKGKAFYYLLPILLLSVFGFGLLSPSVYSTLDFYLQKIYVSLVNRYGSGGLFDDLYLCGGFIETEFTFGDSGYLDTACRFSLLGLPVYYFLYFNFLRQFGLPLIIPISLMFFEMGHSYSKSFVFLPVIILLLLLIKRYREDSSLELRLS